MDTELVETSSGDVAGVFFDLDRRIKELSQQIEVVFWRMIGLLAIMDEEKGWEVLGYRSFGEYLSQAELCRGGYAEETVRRYIRTLKEINSHGDDRFFELPRSKLLLVAPHLDGNNADDWYHKAKSLSWRDLRTELQEEVLDKGKPPRPYLQVDYVHGRWCLRKIKNGDNLFYEGRLEDYCEGSG